MTNRNKKTKMSRRSVPETTIVGEKLRAALRSIIRDWLALCKPLPVDEIMPQLPTGACDFRVRGAESHEELQERVIQFAGRVWQLKDGLIRWLRMQPSLRMVFSDAATGARLIEMSGQDAKRMIEEAAELCLPLLLCADLYNTHKHYDDCNRSGYQPFLNGVQFDTSQAGVCGISYDGTRVKGDMTVSKPIPVPIRIEVHSRNHPVNFGDAVIVVGRAFCYWIPLIRQIDLLSPSAVRDEAILHDLDVVEEDVKKSNPFKLNDTVVDLHLLPIEERRLAQNDPAAFIAKIQNPSEDARGNE